MATEDQAAHRNPDVRHERSDLSMFGLATTVIGTLAGTLLIVGLLAFLFQFLRSQHESIADVFRLPERFQNMTREPVLQRSPTHDLEEFQREQTRRLHSYTWTDRERGLVSIPIERAIQAVAEKGLPAAEAMPDLQLGIPSTTHRQTGFDAATSQTGEAR